MKIRKTDWLVAALIGLLVPFARPGHAAEEEPIALPPEVLEKMDPNIVTNKRPEIVTIKQADIFNLRAKPQKNADFVTFDFDVDSLTSVQRKIVEHWAPGGHNKLLFVNAQIEKYAALLGLKAGHFKAAVYLQSEDNEASNHVVNTDCVDVRFSTLPVFYYENLPTNSTVIVERRGRAICGALPLEETMVYFFNTPGGSDGPRWKLNYMHWALGLPVPGVAETGVPRAPGITLREAETHDALSMKNGDVLYGTVATERFTIKTSYAPDGLSFKREDVDKIVFDGQGPNSDVMILKDGDRLSGAIQETKVKVQLITGTESELDKGEIKEIRMARAKVK